MFDFLGCLRKQKLCLSDFRITVEELAYEEVR